MFFLSFKKSLGMKINLFFEYCRVYVLLIKLNSFQKDHQPFMFLCLTAFFYNDHEFFIVSFFDRLVLVRLLELPLQLSWLSQLPTVLHLYLNTKQTMVWNILQKQRIIFTIKTKLEIVNKRIHLMYISFYKKIRIQTNSS